MAQPGGEELNCPRCQTALQITRTAHGVFWGCAKCGGRAINVELLRRTFSPESINPLWLHAIRGEGMSSCACPSCANAMTEVSLSDAAGVRVDVCKLCHFVWFDMHETDTLRPREVPKPRETLRKRVEPDLTDNPWKQISDFLM